MQRKTAMKQRSFSSKEKEKKMSENRYLTFALAKGRLAKQTLAVLEKIGITCEEMKDKERPTSA